jgi:hypothetical protein
MSQDTTPNDVNLGVLRQRIAEIEHRLLVEISHELDLLHAELGVSPARIDVEMRSVQVVGRPERIFPFAVHISVEL